MTKSPWRLFAVLALFPVFAMAADRDPGYEHNWPNWRGPLSNGIAPHGDPPVEWSATKNVKWKVPVPGKGSATPIVWGDRIFVLTAIPAGESKASGGSFVQRPGRDRAPTDPYQFCAIAYDRATGAEVWRKVATEHVPHEPGHQTNTFASGSPTTDGKYLYVSFGSYGVFRFDLEGNLDWKVDLGDMRTRNGFGEGASPVLHGDRLIVAWDHEEDSALFALDANTGETIWKVPRDEPTTWMTPLVVEFNGRTQIITNGTNRSRSYDFESGELLWECGGQVTNPIASPLVKDDLAYCMTGYRGYAVYAIPLSAQGDVTGTDRIRWKRSDVGPYIASALLYDNRLYVTKSRESILVSLNAETGGTVFDAARMPGLNTLYASPVAARGRIYFTDRSGNTCVLKHSDQFEVLTTNSLDEGIDASPAIVGRQMFLRSSEHLYCIEAP